MRSQKHPIAHAVKDGEDWRLHLLEDHLRDVAFSARAFARSFGAEDWAELAGMWHDLGKYRQRFQSYIGAASGLAAEGAHIEQSPGRVTHSTAGALLAVRQFGVRGHVLAYLIAGHHAGLDDWDGGLQCRLSGTDAHDELAEALAANPPPDILAANSLPADLSGIPGGAKGFALWVRMLFSCLVDADFLDTEAFMQPAKAAGRGAWPALADLKGRLDSYMAALDARSEATPVNAARRQIRQHCLIAAALAPGTCTLTVPTGGGKTLSSTAFALEHQSAGRALNRRSGRTPENHPVSVSSCCPRLESHPCRR